VLFFYQFKTTPNRYFRVGFRVTWLPTNPLRLTLWRWLRFGYFTQRTLATTVEMPVASSANRTRNSDVAVIADRTAYTTYGILTNIKPISVTSWRTAGTHDPIQRVEFMNASKLNLLKRDWRSRSQWITGRNATMARLIVCLKNSRSRFLPLFRCVLWLNDTSYSKSVTLNGQIGTCLLGTCWYNF